MIENVLAQATHSCAVEYIVVGSLQMFTGNNSSQASPLQQPPSTGNNLPPINATPSNGSNGSG